MFITLYRTDPAGSVHYYTIHDRQTSLFTSHSFTIIWGRSADRGKQRVYLFDSRIEMDGKIRQVLRERHRKGYRVLYSYFRHEEKSRFAEELRTIAAS